MDEILSWRWKALPNLPASLARYMLMKDVQDSGKDERGRLVMQKHNAGAILMVALVVLVLGSSMALADDLYLGGPYNTIYTSVDPGGIGGGSIGGSTLNSASLPWVYCVDYYDTVGVPGTYSNTFVNNSGTIAGSQTNSTNSGITGFNGTNGSQTAVTNAMEVAWLLQNYATGADTNAQIGLQGAIWRAIYGITLTSSNSNTALTDYNKDWNALQAAVNAGNFPNYIGNFDWLSPQIPNGNSVYQGLVTVPDGGTTLMLLGGALVGLGTLRRKFRA
jgi:hypothetical protein